MAEKLEIKVGDISFSGEGDGAWLAEQLDKVLKQLPEIAKLAPTAAVTPPPHHSSGAGHPHQDRPAPATGTRTGTLAAFLTEKQAAAGSQTRKFLATALW